MFNTQSEPFVSSQSNGANNIFKIVKIWDCQAIPPLLIILGYLITRIQQYLVVEIYPMKKPYSQAKTGKASCHATKAFSCTLKGETQTKSGEKSISVVTQIAVWYLILNI